MFCGRGGKVYRCRSERSQRLTGSASFLGRPALFGATPVLHGGGTAAYATPMVGPRDSDPPVSYPSLFPQMAFFMG